MHLHSGLMALVLFGFVLFFQRLDGLPLPTIPSAKRVHAGHLLKIRNSLRARAYISGKSTDIFHLGDTPVIKCWKTQDYFASLFILAFDNFDRGK